MGWALRKFVKMIRLALLRIGKIKEGVDKEQAIMNRMVLVEIDPEAFAWEVTKTTDIRDGSV